MSRLKYWQIENADFFLYFNMIALIDIINKYKMFRRNLIAVCCIVLAVQGALVSVGDNQEFKYPTFSSIFKVSNLVINESVTVSLQWADQVPQFGIDVYLFSTVPGTDQGTPLECPDESNTCSVTFDGTYTETSGDYWVSVEFRKAKKNDARRLFVGGPYDFQGQSVLVSTIVVTGDSITRINPILLKQTFTIGYHRFHRVYFVNPTDISIILPFTDDDQLDWYSEPLFVRVFPETLQSPLYTLGTEVDIGRPIQDDVAKTLTWTFPVAANYSWIVIDLTNANDQPYPDLEDFAQIPFQWRISYPTETYTCPNIPDYPDVSGIFRGCQYLSDNSKLPCIDWNTVTSKCQACYTGYTVVNGRCVEANCPSGQFKRYGECIANPIGCVSYSDFSKCSQCSSDYTLNSGVCSRTILTCSERTFFNSVSWTCDKVDDKCKTWGTDGKCTSCLSATEKPVNGVCVSIESTCTATQYVDAKGDCVENDPVCETFEKWGGKCIRCFWGYQVTEGKCVKIVCAERQTVDDYGKCVKVSDLCEVYDARGNCLGCIPTHVLSKGVCLQSQSPNPCPAGQYMGNDNFCHGASDFCEIYSRTSGQCSQCINGYFLMYTGQCVLQKTCKPRQILINNDCHDVSPTCGNYDRATGKCLNCVSEAYELYYGLCIPVTSCGVRQWTDNTGACHQVDVKCNAFNPSTGACISCVQGYNYLNGICCVKGQFNVNGVCAIATSASANINSDGCRIYYQGVGCVRCENGFQKLADQVGFYYCQAL